MKKEENTEKGVNELKEQLIEKIDLQVEQIQDVFDVLVKGMDMSQLPLKERLLLAARFASLKQRGLMMKHTVSKTIVDDKGHWALIEIARKMRGEVEDEEEDEEFNDFQVIDGDIAIYPVDEGGGL